MGRDILKVEDIRTRFGSQEVHRGISFGLEAGSVTALIGGSGSGKSVLLKEIIGLLRPASGSVELFGQDVWSSMEQELSSLRGRIGVLFQNGALFSNLSVAQNIAVPLRESTDLDKNLIARLVELRLSLADLPLSAGRKMPSELSGGMIKRAGLARALALEPEILFLDEPTSGLDPITARGFDKLVRTLCDGLGISVFLVTHDLDTLESIVDRVIVLADGLVIADGSVERIRKVKHPWVEKYFSSRATSDNRQSFKE